MGGSYTVTVSTDVTVGGLSTIGTVTLDITTGALSISGAATSDLAGPVDNSGDLQLQDGAAVTVAGNLTNSGGLYVDNGGSGGSNLTIDGTLTNSNYIQIGDGSVAATVSAAGLSDTGQIVIQGGSTNQALLKVAAAAPSSWTGTVTLSGNGLLEFGGTSEISAIASGGEINLYGPQALVAAAGLGTTSDTALSALTSNAGQLLLWDGSTLTLTSSGGLTNSGSVLVDNGGSGGSNLTIDGTLTNSNYIQIGDGSVAATVSAAGLSDTGQIVIQGGSTNQALLKVAAAAPSSWTGTVTLSGNGLLEFGGTSEISAIASGGEINLYGPQALVAAAGLGTTSDTALSALTSNAGQLLLQDGGTLTLTSSSGLTNSGSVLVDNGGSGGSNLTIDGTLTNSNYIQIGDGSVAATVSAAGLSDTGQIVIQGGSTNQALLKVAAAAPSSWTGTVTLSGNGLLEFGGTSEISAIASGGEINLYGPQALVAAAGLGTTSDTALSALTSNAGQLLLQDGGTLTLTSSSGLTNSGSLLVDNGGSGGSNLTIDGTLTNSNYVQIGDGSAAGEPRRRQ